MMPPPENDPINQGKLLREALAERVRGAIRLGEITNRGKHHYIAVDDLIIQYLPEGSTFDYAEEVLRSAGFAVDFRPKSDAPPGILAGSEYEFDVNALSNQKELEGAVCVVALRPARPYDYGVVHLVLTTCDILSVGAPKLQRPPWYRRYLSSPF
jgi:hypothetical protein